MNRLSKASLGAIGVCSLFALGSTAVAQASHLATVDSTSSTSSTSTTAPVNAATSTTTLPLLGVPLVIDVTTSPSGAINSVIVNPSTGLTATKVKSNRVKFVSADGSVKVTVDTGHGGQATTAKAGTLAQISGPGGWKGDVFNTGATTTVAFTIGALPDGSPDITGVTSSDATAVFSAVDHRSDEDRQVAVEKVLFTSGIQSRTLLIAASVGSHDGESQARVVVALSKINGLALPTAQVAGPQKWSGMLCDGSTATINYVVNADGTLTPGAVVPATATIKAGDNADGFVVMFSDTERVSVRSHTDNGQTKVNVEPRLRCGRTDPSVNTPTSTTPDNTGGDGGGDQGSHDGQGGGHHGHDGHDDTSTSVASGSADPTSSSLETGDGGHHHRGGGDATTSTVSSSSSSTSSSTTSAP